MIYPGIDIERTKRNTEVVLKGIKQIFGMNLYSFQCDISSHNIGEIDFDQNLIIHCPTKYDKVIHSVLRAVNLLDWNEKYIFIQHFVYGISLSDLKVGRKCELEISNVYCHYQRLIKNIGLLVSEFIEYRE